MSYITVLDRDNGRKFSLPIHVTNVSLLYLGIAENAFLTENSFVVYFNEHIVERSLFPLSNLGFSPPGTFEIKRISDKILYFSFYCHKAYSLYEIQMKSYKTIFSTKILLSNYFHTVPQNINLILNDKILENDESIENIQSSSFNRIFIDFINNHFVYRVKYDTTVNYFCMEKDATIRDLIQIYAANSSLYFNFFKPAKDYEYDLRLKSIQESTIELSDKPNPPNEVPKFSDLNLKIGEINTELNLFDNLGTIYCASYLLEKKIGVDRALFRFSHQGEILDKNKEFLSSDPNQISIETKCAFKVKDKKDAEHEVPILFKYSDIVNYFQKDKRKIISCTGVVINGVFINDYSEYLVRRFYNFTDNRIDLIEPKNPCLKHRINYTNSDKKEVVKTFIIPRDVGETKIFKYWLNMSSNGACFSINKEEKENNFEWKTDHSVFNQNFVQISLNPSTYQVLNEEKNETKEIQIDYFSDILVKEFLAKLTIKKPFKSDPNIDIFYKNARMPFWKKLSSFRIGSKDIIKLCKNTDKSKVAIYDIDTEKNIGENVKITNKTVEKIVSQIQKYYKNKIALFSDFVQLDGTDSIAYCRPTLVNYFTISTIEPKRIIFQNESGLNLVYDINPDISDHDFRLSDLILGLLKVPKIDFYYRFREDNVLLPLCFTNYAFPKVATITMKYKCSNTFQTFSYINKKIIKFENLNDPISKQKCIIQQKFRAEGLLLFSPNCISFSIFRDNLPETVSFQQLMIPEDTTIRIIPRSGVKKNIFILNKKYLFSFTKSDKIKELRTLVSLMFDVSIDTVTIINMDYIALSDDHEIDDNSAVSFNKVKVTCKGKLGSKIFEFDEIYNISEIKNIIANDFKLNIDEICITTDNIIQNDEVKLVDLKGYEITAQTAVKLSIVYPGCTVIATHYLPETAPISAIKDEIAHRMNKKTDDMYFALKNKMSHKNKIDNLLAGELPKDDHIFMNIFKSMFQPKNQQKQTIVEDNQPKQTEQRAEDKIEFDNKKQSMDQISNADEGFNKDQIAIIPKKEEKEEETRAPIKIIYIDEEEDSEEEEDQIIVIPLQNQLKEEREKAAQNPANMFSLKVVIEDPFDDQIPLNKEKLQDETIVYSFQRQPDEPFELAFRPGATIADAKEKIARKYDDVCDTEAVVINMFGKALKEVIVMDNLALTKNNLFQIYVYSDEKLCLRSALGFQRFGAFKSSFLISEFSEYYSDDEENP